MKKREIDQYDMLLSVENHFVENSTVWADNEPITAANTVLSQKIDEIADQVAIQLVSSNGSTIDKAYLRTDLENKGYLISASVSAYAAATPGKGGLYKWVHYSKTHFQQFKDLELMGAIDNLHSNATAELTHLAPFGVTSATLTELLAAKAAFGASMKDPIQAIATRKSASDKIPVLLRETIDMLETQMDNLIVAYGVVQPEFAAIYWNVRAIHNSGTRHLSLTVTTVDAGTNAPVANADLVIVGEGITRVSSERGYNTVRNLSEGSHELTISHPSFETQTVYFTVVQGETTELVVYMQGMLQPVL